MNTTAWFEKNPPKTEAVVQNGVFLQRRWAAYRAAIVQVLKLSRSEEAIKMKAALSIEPLAKLFLMIDA